MILAYYQRVTYPFLLVAIIVACLLLPAITYAAEQTIAPQLLTQLTAAEKSYLKQHTTITVQNESNFAPFNFTLTGKPVGYSIDIMNQVSEQLGLRVKYLQNKTWDQYLLMLQTNKIDTMINIAPSPQRSRYALFTPSYAQISIMAITRKNNTQISQSEQAIGKQRIAVVENYAGGAILQRKFPNAKFVVFDSAEQALRAIANQKADIFFGNGVMANYYIEKNFIAGLAFSPAIDSLNLSVLSLSIATHKSNPILASLLQKSVESIPEHVKIQLRKKWGAGGIPDLPKVQLTVNEQDYLNMLGTIRIGSGVDYPPHTFIENDLEQGYTIDLLKLLGDMLNVKLEFVHANWSEHLKSVQSKN